MSRPVPASSTPSGCTVEAGDGDVVREVLDRERPEHDARDRVDHGLGDVDRGDTDLGVGDRDRLRVDVELWSPREVAVDGQPADRHREVDPHPVVSHVADLLSGQAADRRPVHQRRRLPTTGHDGAVAVGGGDLGQGHVQVGHGHGLPFALQRRVVGGHPDRGERTAQGLGDEREAADADVGLGRGAQLGLQLGGQRVLGDGVGHPVTGDQHRQHGQHAHHGDHHGARAGAPGRRGGVRGGGRRGLDSGAAGGREHLGVVGRRSESRLDPGPVERPGRGEVGAAATVGSRLPGGRPVRWRRRGPLPLRGAAHPPRPSRSSMPMVSPGRSTTARTAASTPGMKDTRSKESWRTVRVSPGSPNRTSW